ncbi:MAG: hypothetical protein QXL01_00865 [Thermoplasmatales archaeon]
MKIWLDDLRPKPPEYDVHCYTAHEAIALIKSGLVTHISLDHDLGSDDAGTGHDVAKFIEMAAYHNKIPRLAWSLHTTNPVGRRNMKDCLEAADIFWSQHGK